MVKRIYRLSALVLALAAVLAVFYDPKRIVMSAVVGGVLGLVNLRGLVRSVNGLLGARKAAGKMMALSFFRLIAIFLILLVLFKYGRVNPIGILIGFTVVFAVIMAEGLREARTRGGDGDIITPS